MGINDQEAATRDRPAGSAVRTEVCTDAKGEVSGRLPLTGGAWAVNDRESLGLLLPFGPQSFPGPGQVGGPGRRLGARGVRLTSAA